VAAIEPVADRLLKRFKAARRHCRMQRRSGSQDRQQGGTGCQGRDEHADPVQARLGTFLRVYAFLSQVFDYGNTAIEKRAIFYKRLLPLLDFGRDREGVDLSKVVLTHHKLKDQGSRHAGAA
jgi:type I restriction enzyme R subunit